MKLPLYLFLTTFALLGSAPTLFAQDTESKPTPKPETESEEKKDEGAKEEDEKDRFLVIRGADVHVGTGSIVRRATVVVKNDKIEAVGRDVELPDEGEDVETIDATGKVLSPGFVAVRGSGLGAPSTFGLEEVKDSLNPYDPSIKLGLACGITSFGMLADAGRDAPKGKSAVIKLTPGDLDGMLCTTNTVASMRVPLTPRQWKEFRGLVEKAQKFRDERDNPKPKDDVEKAEKGKTDEKAKADSKRPSRTRRRSSSKKGSSSKPKPPRGTEVLVKILDGKRKLWIDLGNASRGWFFRGATTSDNDKIRQAIEIADLLDVGVVLNQPITAWVTPDAIAKTGSMVILSPRSRLKEDPTQPENTGSNIASAAILDAAGVPVAVTAPSPRLSLDGLYGQDLSTPHVDAAYAVRGGLENRKALRTITLDAAAALGVDARLGSVEVGKDADLLILDGDPLHYRTLVDTAIVNGKVVYDRQKEPFFGHIQR